MVNLTKPTKTHKLFPSLKPYASGYLEVDHGHNLYWEQSGNPDGVPIVLLHGGPGAGATPTHRRFFDPDYYRIVIFDQRGCGRSHPLGSLENNTRKALISDMEALREKLRIPQWHLFGGSWGATLALSYAQAHPARCMSLILRGIFLCEQTEINWFLHGMGTIFPEAHEEFTHFIPKKERGDLLNAYYKRLTSDNEQECLAAAVRWSLYESACASLVPHYETIRTKDQKLRAIALARLEAHYFKHEAIPARSSLLKGIDKIRKIPTTIIQGRYDVICPIATAHKLSAAWPEADYIIVPKAGHSALDSAILSRLIEATENAKTI